MQIIYEGFSILTMLKIIAILTIFGSFWNTQQLSMTGYFSFKYYLAVKLSAFALILGGAAVISFLWYYLDPKSLSEEIYGFLQIAFCIFLSEALSLCIAWLLKGDKRQWMKLWNET